MSQPYVYSDEYSQQQYYSPTSYDTMQYPAQHIQSHASSYGYQNNDYNTGFAPNGYTVNSSPQSYTYSNVGYPTNTAASNFSHYGYAPDRMVPQYPDSANQVPHQDMDMTQYSDAPDQSWAGTGQVTTVQPSDLHGQRRGSCASMNTNKNGWYSCDDVSGGYRNHTQPTLVEQNYYGQSSFQYQHQHQCQQQPQSDLNFGMHSPSQFPRTRELAFNVPYGSADQWMSDATMSEGSPEVPYGTLPIHEPKIQYERRLSNDHQMFDNGSIGHHHPGHASPCALSHPESPSAPGALLKNPDSTQSNDPNEDLYVQQRQAAGYQQGLQAQQERKYQLSTHFQRFEASHRGQDSFTQHAFMVTPDAPRRQHHPAHHRQSSSSSSYSHRLVSAPIVPSQARERALPYARVSMEVEEKKEAPPKKPALACLFCRKRKIACGPPAPDSTNRTCNQCFRRKQSCEYPTESRRGIRKTPKEPAPAEPTVHKFVHGDARLHEGGVGPIRSRPRRKNGD